MKPSTHSYPDCLQPILVYILYIMCIYIYIYFIPPLSGKFPVHLLLFNLLTLYYNLERKVLLLLLLLFKTNQILFSPPQSLQFPPTNHHSIQHSFASRICTEAKKWNMEWSLWHVNCSYEAFDMETVEAKHRTRCAFVCMLLLLLLHPWRAGLLRPPLSTFLVFLFLVRSIY